MFAGNYVNEFFFFFLLHSLKGAYVTSNYRPFQLAHKLLNVLKILHLSDIISYLSRSNSASAAISYVR